MRMIQTVCVRACVCVCVLAASAMKMCWAKSSRWVWWVGGWVRVVVVVVERGEVGEEEAVVVVVRWGV